MTSMAMPATTMSYGAPMVATGSFVAAPAMTSTAMPATTMSYAAPMAAMPMPTMAMSYAQPMAATQSRGSFVAPALPTLPTPQMPAQPRSLTGDIPDPRSIEHQKHMYYKA